MDTDPQYEPRKRLRHEVPGWVADGSIYFVTVCAAKRGVNILAVDGTGQRLIESVLFRHENGMWCMRLFLIMPDHVHAFVSVPIGSSLKSEIESWKRYAAREFGVNWQPGFFDHRLRGHEAFSEKWDYVRLNPVRAGLVETPDEWPWVWMADDLSAYLE